MSAFSLAKRTERFPSSFEDFFRTPFPDWFDGGVGKIMQIPAVNIVENKKEYQISLAAPGLKKEDFKIGLEGDVLSISSESEEEKEQEDEKFTRKEYSFSSFCRSFAVPEDVNKDKIDAQYQDGVLSLVLPKKENAAKPAISKQILV